MAVVALVRRLRQRHCYGLCVDVIVLLLVEEAAMLHVDIDLARAHLHQSKLAARKDAEPSTIASSWYPFGPGR